MRYDDWDCAVAPCKAPIVREALGAWPVQAWCNTHSQTWCCDVSASLCHHNLRLDKAAAFNRRMRKTARPVVWEAGGAQSPSVDPIQKSEFSHTLFSP